MMKIDLKLRFQSVEEVVRELEAFQELLKKPPEPVNANPKGRYADPELGSDDDIFFRPGFEQKAIVPKIVLCVEMQSTIQEAFRKSLSQMGYRVLLVTSAEVAAERYREKPPDAVVFDADGQGPDALDSFLDMHEKAHEDGHELSAVVLLGVKQGELAGMLPKDDKLVVLKKPIKMKDVQDALTELVPMG
jgi:eukaryotic-like serine/threonine-protein kinase